LGSRCAGLVGINLAMSKTVLVRSAMMFVYSRREIRINGRMPGRWRCHVAFIFKLSTRLVYRALGLNVRFGKYSLEKRSSCAGNYAVEDNTAVRRLSDMAEYFPRLAASRGAEPF